MHPCLRSACEQRQQKFYDADGGVWQRYSRRLARINLWQISSRRLILLRRLANRLGGAIDADFLLQVVDAHMSVVPGK